MKNNQENNQDKKIVKSKKSTRKKKRRRQRHEVRGILRELTTFNEDQYYDYIDEIEEK
jgi:hypothetical protein